MSVYFIGCPHFGHKAIAKYRPWVENSNDNTIKISNDWRLRIKKKDIVMVLGDAAFDDEGIDVIGNLPGRKILIKGNHDDMVSTAKQMEVFEEIHGMLKYKAMWLTHCPIHPDELRGKPNLHAHVHVKSIKKRGLFKSEQLDRRYLNACVDTVYPGLITGRPYASFLLSLDEVKTYFGR